MTVRCPACDHDSDCTYRCDNCGRDLVEEDDREIATDGGIPLAGGQADDESEYYVVDEDRAAVVAGPFDDNQAARTDAKERAPGHIVTTGRVLEMMEATSDQPIRWQNDEDDVDVVTDGGRYQCPVCAHPYNRDDHDHCPNCHNSGLDEFATDGGQPTGTGGGGAAPPEPEPESATDDLAHAMDHPPGRPHHCAICDTYHASVVALVDHACDDHDDVATDGGEPAGAIDNSFADAERPRLHVGDHVTDREDDDATTLLVAGLPGETAEEVTVDSTDTTVAEYNDDYPATDAVVQVVYPQRTDSSLTVKATYSFPRSRLQLEECIHDDGGEET